MADNVTDIPLAVLASILGSAADTYNAVTPASMNTEAGTSNSAREMMGVPENMGLSKEAAATLLSLLTGSGAIAKGAKGLKAAKESDVLTKLYELGLNSGGGYANLPSNSGLLAESAKYLPHGVLRVTPSSEGAVLESLIAHAGNPKQAAEIVARRGANDFRSPLGAINRTVPMDNQGIVAPLVNSTFKGGGQATEATINRLYELLQSGAIK